jgi:hypothetical protein
MNLETFMLASEHTRFLLVSLVDGLSRGQAWADLDDLSSGWSRLVCPRGDDEAWSEC